MQVPWRFTLSRFTDQLPAFNAWNCLTQFSRCCGPLSGALDISALSRFSSQLTHSLCLEVFGTVFPSFEILVPCSSESLISSGLVKDVCHDLNWSGWCLVSFIIKLSSK